MKRPTLDLTRLTGWRRGTRAGGSTILALALDGRRLEGVVARRTNGSAEVLQRFTATLTLDPREAEPTALGRELRQHLDAAGVRERRCVIAVPPQWLFTVSVPLPELPEADLESLIQLEAERGFPVSPDSLVVARSRYRTEAGVAGVTLLGLAREHVERLEAVARAARLRLVSLTLGLAALPGLNGHAAAGGGVLMLVPGEQTLGVQVACSGGLALIRTLDPPLAAGPEGTPDFPALARELRITLGQLPPEVEQTVRRVCVVGASPEVERLTARLDRPLAEDGLTVEALREMPANGGLHLPAGLPVSVPLAVAVRYLAGGGTGVEFLPPRVSRWEALAARYTTSRTAARAALAVAAVVVLTAGAFGVQQARLAWWRSRWNGMREAVTELEALQQRVRQYRSWYDESFRTLSILRRLTEAFPEDGAVSAKSVEIRPNTGVTCSGTARDNAALLRVLDKLRAAPEVRGLKVEQIRGNAPMQFTVNFQWSETGAP
jgi:hypothetical protein